MELNAGVQIMPLRSNMVESTPPESEALACADLKRQVERLESGQKTELMHRVEEDSRTYFEEIERWVETATRDILERYHAGDATLNSTSVAEVLQQQGMDETSAA